MYPVRRVVSERSMIPAARVSRVRRSVRFGAGTGVISPPVRNPSSLLFARRVVRAIYIMAESAVGREDLLPLFGSGVLVGGDHSPQPINRIGLVPYGNPEPHQGVC
ncbi:MAG: hypothetical protein Ct9H300mP11_02340 [Chloroflexota bacterium]|nr:MAG: hypothetical protein Ct9H300mP11_02340 [Chloroflexota bacterium]